MYPLPVNIDSHVTRMDNPRTFLPAPSLVSWAGERVPFSTVVCKKHELDRPPYRRPCRESLRLAHSPRTHRTHRAGTQAAGAGTERFAPVRLQDLSEEPEAAP